MALLVRAIEAINSARGVNYRLSWAKVNAADFGVPQSREHVFVIGDREGTSFRFPAPTHGPDQNGLLGALETVRTSWEAIGDLEVDSSRPDLQLRGKWADLVRTIPEGHNYLWHTSRGGGVPLFGWRRRYWSFLLKLAKNRPSWTIQAAPGPATGPFHWEKPPTVREGALPSTDLSGRLSNSGEPFSGSETARECSASCARGDPCEEHSQEPSWIQGQDRLEAGPPWAEEDSAA